MDASAITDQLGSVSLGGTEQTGENSNNSSSAEQTAENSPPPSPVPDSKFCSACGKAGTPGGDLKKCTACKSVWYCGVNCQIDHRKAHKKECKRIKKELAAREKQEGQKGEMEDANKDEKFSLFNPEPRSGCPICMVVMPLHVKMQMYMSCCGKIICGGCIYANYMVNADGKCPFCRQSAPDSQEKILEGMMARAESGDARAIFQLSTHYEVGRGFGLQMDSAKSLGLLQQAADLGCIEANSHLGEHYRDSYGGLTKSYEKARLHWEFAAKKGDPDAHHNLGELEFRMRHRNGHIDLSIRHLRISAQLGNKKSVRSLQNMAKFGYLGEEELKEAENAYRGALEAMRTEDRDEHNALHHIDWDVL